MTIAPSITALALLMALAACESQVEKYHRLEHERDVAERESTTAMRQSDSIKALITAGRGDSATLARMEYEQNTAFGKAILANARRKDAELEMSFMGSR